MTKVSIIIPVYNVAPYLKRSLDSVCNQTLKDIDIICIDDCSTDNSLEILKEYEQKDNRIKVITLEKNCGASTARNKGLEIAKGEYLGFIDPDDEIDLNYYEELYNEAKKNNYDVVKCIRKTIELDGRVTYSDLNDIIKDRGIYFFLWEWTTAIYKSSVIYDNNIRFPDECKKGEDVAFLTQIGLYTDSIKIIDSVCYTYFRRKGSLNASKVPLEYIKSALLALTLQLESIENSNIFKKNKDLYTYLYLIRIDSVFNLTLFQNDSFEAKSICAKWIVDSFYKCRDIKALKKKFTYKYFLKYITRRNVKKLTIELNKCKTRSDLYPLYRNIFQRIFSITKTADKTHKVITILGIKIMLKKTKEAGCQN